MKLLVRALVKTILGFLGFCLMVFLPAGTLNYPNAWLLAGVLFIPMLAIGLVTYLRAPELLEKRLSAKESNPEQKTVIALSAALFLAVFVVAGLDYRFGWSKLPFGVSIAAATVFLVGYALYAEVMRENVYLSRTVEVQQNQKVVDTGLYGLVRHPMYFATLLMFGAMPLALGSLYAFALMLCCYGPIIVKRIKDEERTLSEGLEGYTEYMQKVKHRLLPFIW